MDDQPEAVPKPTDSLLSSVHSTSFPELLAQFNASVLVTTYQAGKLVILRNQAGVLNTHFRGFAKPMGLALAKGKLAVGSFCEIQEFHNVPAVCSRLDELDKERNPEARVHHDACFVPRRTHTTGDVQIHEMAWIDDELWFVNTAFSCLCVRSDAYSFEPRWRPPFISQLSPDDACHLNGLAVRDGRPAYATALGAISEPGGWRENKRNGGVLIDIESNSLVLDGLSMPHSPRWYRDRLWLCESGDGSFGFIDPRSGRYEAITHLPGFTRGVAFLGPFALIGLSQVRESAVFSGIPVVDRLSERLSGVWVVHIDTAETVAFVKFEGGVQEVFAVEVLPGTSHPDVINDSVEIIGRSYVLPDDAMALVPPEIRTSSN